MDEKAPPQQPIMSLRRSSRPIVVVFLLFAVLFSLWQWLANGALPLTGRASNHGTMTGTSRRLVPLEAHIISKCPDTRVCVLGRSDTASAYSRPTADISRRVGRFAPADPPRHATSP